MNIFDKTKNWYKDLPEKKKYVELLTAVLTVPVLVTVIIGNLNNLNNKNKEAQKEQTKVEKQTVYVIPTDKKETTPTLSANVKGTSVECKKQVGPVEITNPDEGEMVMKNPVCIDISYKTGEYCSVAWSYRINGGSWSDYTDKSVCLYNLPAGNKNLELKVKSIASDDEVVLKRNFIYQGLPTPTLDNSKNGSSSAQ